MGSVCLKNENYKFLPHILPNLYDFISSLEHKRTYFEKCFSGLMPFIARYRQDKPVEILASICVCCGIKIGIEDYEISMYNFDIVTILFPAKIVML